MLLYAISAGEGDPSAVVEHAKAAFSTGVDWFQVREKSMPARELRQLTERIVAARPAGRRVLVNTHAEIAIAAGADGVHLPSDAESPAAIRAKAPAEFTIGVSCHALSEAQAAEGAGADYLCFSPIFDTPSKREFGPPQGLESLRAVCAQVTIPVFALGGVTAENAEACIVHGAQGVAGIRLFVPAGLRK